MRYNRSVHTRMYSVNKLFVSCLILFHPNSIGKILFFVVLLFRIPASIYLYATFRIYNNIDTLWLYIVKSIFPVKQLIDKNRILHACVNESKCFNRNLWHAISKTHAFHFKTENAMQPFKIWNLGFFFLTENCHSLENDFGFFFKCILFTGSFSISVRPQ